MPTLPDLIAATYSAEAATAFAACTLSPAGRSALAETGIALMERFPPVPRACCAMGALYAAALRSAAEAPAYLIAGKLYADDVRVFGTARSFPDAAMPFLRTDLDWDGHMWIAIGEYLADISLLPTARSAGASEALSALVAREFGPGDRLVIGKAADLQRIGLVHVPEYALTPEEVDALARGAEADLPQRG